MRHALGMLLLTTLGACSAGDEYAPRDGDIVFHESQSRQSEAIMVATRSRYSHMGIVYVRGGEPYVFEAVQAVKMTPLDDWIARGAGGHFVAKRLKEADRLLTRDELKKMQAVGESLANRDYDLYFEWSDDRMYCSELVWKIFDRGAGIEVGKLQRMADFDLSHPLVRQRLRERFGDAVPLDEIVISPEAMYSASNLVTVYEN